MIFMTMPCVLVAPCFSSSSIVRILCANYTPHYHLVGVLGPSIFKYIFSNPYELLDG